MQLSLSFCSRKADFYSLGVLHCAAIRHIFSPFQPKKLWLNDVLHNA